MEKIRPIHQSEIPQKKKIISKSTNFGLEINKENLGEYFCNDPK